MSALPATEAGRGRVTKLYAVAGRKSSKSVTARFEITFSSKAKDSLFFAMHSVMKFLEGKKKKKPQIVEIFSFQLSSIVEIRLEAEVDQSFEFDMYISENISLYIKKKKILLNAIIRIYRIPRSSLTILR